MKISEDIRSVSYLKTHTTDVLHQVNETHRPIIITQNDQPAAVIQDAKTYEENQKALTMLKLLAQAEQDIAMGRTLDHKTVVERLKKKIKIKYKKS